jgi:hypothetical protein
MVDFLEFYEQRRQERAACIVHTGTVHLVVVVLGRPTLRSRLVGTVPVSGPI